MPASRLQPLAEKMNEMAKKYNDTSRPAYCAEHGFVDEIVDLTALRGYLKAFAGAVYQNPTSICPRHQMLRRGSSGGRHGIRTFTLDIANMTSQGISLT